MEKKAKQKETLENEPPVGTVIYKPMKEYSVNFSGPIADSKIYEFVKFSESFANTSKGFLPMWICLNKTSDSEFCLFCRIIPKTFTQISSLCTFLYINVRIYVFLYMFISILCLFN